jgi:antitoxin FitA
MDAMTTHQHRPPTTPRTPPLQVRNLDPRVKHALRVRAAHNGRSMEAEARQILTDAVSQSKRQRPSSLADAIHRRFAALGGIVLDEHPPVPVGEPVRFDP